MARLILVLCLGVALFGIAGAKDYSDSPYHNWFKGLRNYNGMPCCDIADGQRIDDADWRSTADGHYQVKLKGEWITVPEEAVINPRNRPVDYAMLWIFNNQIMCFMVGTGS